MHTDGPEEREAQAEYEAQDALERCEVLEAMADERCDFCGGSGLYTRTIGGDGYGDRCCGTMDCDDQPCPECNYNYSRVRP